MNKSILMSIHPKFVEKILSNEKRFEFRKVKTRKYKSNKIFIYSTSPESKIIASAEIEEIIEDNPEKVWNKTKKFSGIDYPFFVEYYKNKNKAFAYKLKNVKKFDYAISLKELGIKNAPQSFMYLEKKLEEHLIEKAFIDAMEAIWELG